MLGEAGVEVRASDASTLADALDAPRPGGTAGSPSSGPSADRDRRDEPPFRCRPAGERMSERDKEVTHGMLLWTWAMVPLGLRVPAAGHRNPVWPSPSWALGAR